MSDDEAIPTTLEEAARIEQDQLWYDLHEAVRDAVRDSWSIRCDNLAWRITNLARLVGATAWESIQVPLLRTGVYERVLTEAGISYAPIDWDLVAHTETVAFHQPT